MSSRPLSRDRYSFANLEEPIELPDLIAIQRESFEWFMRQGLAEAFSDISPIKDALKTVLRHAYGVGHLNEYFVTHACSHQVLGNMSGGVGS